jgi:hypothetical protein
VEGAELGEDAGAAAGPPEVLGRLKVHRGTVRQHL